MTEFIRFGDLSPTDLVSLNLMCMHKKVIHKSDIVLCDGRTIKADMLTSSPGHSNYHKFPTPCPTTADLTIWNTAIFRMSSAFLVLAVKLQEYVGTPHSSPLWLLDNLGTTLHHNIARGNKLYHEVYIPSMDTLARRTQSGQCFVSKVIAYGHSNFQQWASVTLLQEGQVFLHSSLPCFVSAQPVSGFKNVIRGYANQSLWASLDYDGDGSWILEGMLAQSLIIIHDGSYMKEISLVVSSATTMIYCTIANVRCKCTWAKMSTSAWFTVAKYLVVLWHSSYFMPQRPHTVVQFLLSWWTVIITASLSTEITLFDPSLPTNLKRTSFEPSRTSSLPRHSKSNISTSHHMPIKERNGAINPWRNT